MKLSTQQWLDSLPQEEIKKMVRGLLHKNPNIERIILKCEGLDSEEFFEFGTERRTDNAGQERTTS